MARDAQTPPRHAHGESRGIRSPEAAGRGGAADVAGLPDGSGTAYAASQEVLQLGDDERGLGSQDPDAGYEAYAEVGVHD